MLPFTPQDFILQDTDADGLANHRIQRKSVRKLAAVHQEHSLQAIKKGHNLNQVTLDFQDAVAELIRKLPPELQTSFCEMYAEELNALAAENQRQADLMEATEKHQRTLQQQQNRQTARMAIGVALFVAVLVIVAVIKL